MKKSDLDNHPVFKRDKNGIWYDAPTWNYALIFEGRGAVLYDHCEVNGDLEEIRVVKNLQDLDELYLSLTEL